MVEPGCASNRIVTRSPEVAPAVGVGPAPASAAYRALVRAGLRRALNGARALPLFLRLEIVGLSVVSVVLLATYGATSYYEADPGDPGASLVTRVSRLV